MHRAGILDHELRTRERDVALQVRAKREICVKSPGNVPADDETEPLSRAFGGARRAERLGLERMNHEACGGPHLEAGADVEGRRDARASDHARDVCADALAWNG